MVFKTQFSDSTHVPSNPGSPYMNEYGYKYEKDGSKNLVVQGQTNVHELIQVDKDSCDINLIIKRFVQGDSSALDKVRGFYADTTDFPTNYADVLQAISDGNSMFSKLPTDVKEKFNNNPDEFWSAFGSESWLDSIGYSPDVPVNPDDVVVTDVESEVKE